MDPINYMMATGEFHDEQQATEVLKAALQALRDRLPKVKAYNLGVRLPEFLRHFYFEGWHHDQRRTESSNKSEFLLEVKEHMKGEEDYSLADMVPVALKAVLILISENDADEVKAAIPRSLQDIFDSGQTM